MQAVQLPFNTGDMAAKGITLLDYSTERSTVSIEQLAKTLTLHSYYATMAKTDSQK